MYKEQVASILFSCLDCHRSHYLHYYDREFQILTNLKRSQFLYLISTLRYKSVKLNRVEPNNSTSA